MDLLAFEVNWTQHQRHHENFAYDSQVVRSQIAKLLINLSFGNADCKAILCTNEVFMANVELLLKNCQNLVRVCSLIFTSMNLFFFYRTILI